MIRLERLKRILSDFIAGGISWVLFFVYRKIIIEESVFEISETLIYGTIAVAFFWILIYICSGNYIEVRRVSRLNELYRTAIQSILGSILIFFFLIIDDIENYSNYKSYYNALLILTTLHFSTTFIERYILTSHMVHKIQNKKVQFSTILIGNTKSIIKTFNMLDNMSRSMGHDFIGYINTENKAIDEVEIQNLGHIHELEKIIKKYPIEEAIITFDNNTNDTSQIMHALAYHNIITKISPNLSDVFLGKIKPQSFFSISLIEIPKIQMPFFQYVVKRLTDIITSAIALLILSPLFVFISIMVKLSSSGPVFYFQKRLGYKKTTFNIIKFRSMYTNAESKTPLLSSSKDTRITPWGKIMRKYRLDELPQFYNVLIGEMSIVGPRPERAFFANKILLTAPHYKLIYKVKPGITSWGMVKFGYAENIDEMIKRLRYDIIYLYNLSLFHDIQVLIWTIFIVLQGRGK